MGKGCSSQRVCSTPLFSLLPAITALFSCSPPARRSRTGSQVFVFFFFLNPATPLPISRAALRSSTFTSPRPHSRPSSPSSLPLVRTRRRQLPRCSPPAAILAVWTWQQKLFGSSVGLPADHLLSPLFRPLLPSLSSSPPLPSAPRGQPALTGWQTVSLSLVPNRCLFVGGRTGLVPRLLI